MKRIYERPEKIYAELNKLYCDFILDGIKNNITKALNIIYSYNGNNADIKLCIWKTVLSLEIDKIDNGEFWLFMVDKYRKFLKANDKYAYRFYLFSCAMANIKRDRAINAIKYIEKLSLEHNQGDKYCGVMAAYLYNMIGISEAEGFIYIINCYRRGNRSRFLYSVLFKYYSQNKIKTTNLLNPLIKWAVVHNINVDFLIKEYRDEICISLTDYSSIVLRLYEKYPYDFILNQALKYFANNFDYSAKALRIYDIALKKGVLTSDFYESYIISAVRNDIDVLPEKIYDYFMKYPCEDLQCMAKVYSEAFAQKRVNEDIIKFAILCVLNKDFDNYNMHGCLYMYGRKFGVADDFIVKAARAVVEKIFSYELFYNKNAKAVKFVGIKKEHFQEIEIIKAIDGKCIFKSASERFTAVLLDENQRIITGLNLKIKPYISNIDFDMVYSLYNDGFKTTEILIYISDYILKNNLLSDKYEAVLRETFELNVKEQFLSHIAYSLFWLDMENGRLKSAENYINKIDIELYYEEDIEYIAEKAALINAYDVLERVLLKYKSISEAAIKTAVNALVKYNPEKTAVYVCKLILDNFCDVDFFDIIFKYFKGSAVKWSIILDKISYFNNGNGMVTENILKKCLEFSIVSLCFENNFIFYYKNRGNKRLIESCVDFLCGKVMNKGYEVSEKTLYVLEDYFKKTNDYILAFALGHIYINQNIISNKRDEICREIVGICEMTNISFPAFYNCGDEIFCTPFIIKNKPFMYKAKENVKVFVHIKIDDDKKTIKKEMTYFKYGIYILLFPVFSGESVSYFFEEERADGSIITHTMIDYYPQINQVVSDSDDLFFSINNSINMAAAGDYKAVEAILENIAFKDKNLNFKLL